MLTDTLQSMLRHPDGSVAPLLPETRFAELDAAALGLEHGRLSFMEAGEGPETVMLLHGIGTSGGLQVFATFRELAWGCEHFGPQILTGEFVAEPLRFEDFHVHLPRGPGIGVALDEDKLRFYARK